MSMENFIKEHRRLARLLKKTCKEGRNQEKELKEKMRGGADDEEAYAFEPIREERIGRAERIRQARMSRNMRERQREQMARLEAERRQMNLEDERGSMEREDERAEAIRVEKAIARFYLALEKYKSSEARTGLDVFTPVLNELKSASEDLLAIDSKFWDGREGVLDVLHRAIPYDIQYITENDATVTGSGKPKKKFIIDVMKVYRAFKG